MQLLHNIDFLDDFIMNFVKNPSFFTACILALLLGAIGTFAYSPFDYSFIAFFSAFGLIWAATLTQRKTALWTTFIWAVSYFCVGVNWIHVSMIQFGGVPLIVSYLAVFLLACYLALYPLMFAFIAQRFQIKNPFALASLFTFTEYLRGVVFTGFPWLQFGYSQIDTPFANIAQIFGVEGLTFFVMLIAGYLVLLVKNEGKAMISSTAIAFVLALACATRLFSFVETDTEKSPLTVSLVQGNIEQKMKWDPEHFDYTVRTYLNLVTPLLGKSDVVILPESAIPALESQIQPLIRTLQQVASDKDSDIIMGTLYQNNQNALFNSAIVLSHESYQSDKVARYNKHHLVPFGEYVPFGSMLDWMREVFVLPINLSQGHFIQSPLEAKNHRFNTAICYEIIFGDQVQKNQKDAHADYLLTITNDAWFGTSIGPWQHFQMARMRALELGKPLLRAANTGITAIVNADGSVTDQLPQFEANVLTAQIYPTVSSTPFSQWGNSLIYGLSLLILVSGWIIRKFSYFSKG